MSKIYLAAPFDTLKQKAVLHKVEKICIKKNIDYFSSESGSWCSIKTRCEQIALAKFVFVRVDQYSFETIWELGYAFALKIPIFGYTTTSEIKLNSTLVKTNIKLVQWRAIEKFLSGDFSVAQN